MARGKDAVAVHRILMDAFEPFRHDLVPPLLVFRSTAKSIAAGIRTGRHAYALARHKTGGVPAGTLRRTIVRGKHGNVRYWLLSRLAVAPEFQGGGVAADLINWMHEQAARAGMREVRGNVRTALPALIRFYKRFGYRVIGYRSLPRHPRYLTVISRTLD